MEKIKPHLTEIVIFLTVIFLLSWGTYSRNKLWGDKIGFWTDCVKKSPHKGRPYVNLGMVYIETGQYDKALEATQKGIDLDPKFGGAYYNLSIIYQKMGDLNQAIAMAKKTVEVDPDIGLAYYSLGGIYFENGRYEESEEAYKKFLKIYPYYPEVHNLLAIVYAAQKKFDQAVTELEWEIKINPDHALAHSNLGKIYWYEYQNREKAITHLKTALMVDPLLPNRAEIRKLVRLIEGLP